MLHPVAKRVQVDAQPLPDPTAGRRPAGGGPTVRPRSGATLPLSSSALRLRVSGCRMGPGRSRGAGAGTPASQNGSGLRLSSVNPWLVARSCGSTMSGRWPPDAFPPPAVGRGRETRRPRRPDATILLVSRMTERRLSTGTADRCRLTTHGRVDLRQPDRIGWCRVGPHRELASVIALPASARRWDWVPERAACSSAGG